MKRLIAYGDLKTPPAFNSALLHLLELLCARLTIAEEPKIDFINW